MVENYFQIFFEYQEQLKKEATDWIADTLPMHWIELNGCNKNVKWANEINKLGLFQYNIGKLSQPASYEHLIK